MSFAVRAAGADDHAAIDVVVEPAFAPMIAAAVAGGEVDLLRALRAGGHDELVAAEPPTLKLAPMAVSPSVQRVGICGALVRAGLEVVWATGADVVVVLGHADSYPRFGFSAALASSSLSTPYDGDHLFALARDPAALAASTTWRLT